MAAGAVGPAEQHQVLGMAGIGGGAQHKGAAECLHHGGDKGVLSQHAGLDLVRHAGKIRAAAAQGPGCRGGHRAAQQTVLPQGPGQLAAHPAHMLGGLPAGFLHGIRRIGRFLPFGSRSQGIQLLLHLLHGVAGLGSLLRVAAYLRPPISPRTQASY